MSVTRLEFGAVWNCMTIFPHEPNTVLSSLVACTACDTLSVPLVEACVKTAATWHVCKNSCQKSEKDPTQSL
eukprot:5331133-Amphidinium_carterae.1